MVTANPRFDGAAATSPPATRPFVVITGGGSGIGLAIAERFAVRGKSLLLLGRREDVLAKAAAELSAKFSVEVATLPLDLLDPAAIARLDVCLAELSAHADVLVNNAAIGYSGFFRDMEMAEIDRLITLNVTVPLRLMRHVLADMQQRGSGGILNVASLGAVVPGPYQAAYYASKAALLSASEAIGAEVRSQGIRVTCVVPGPVETSFHARMGAESAFYRRFLPSASPARVARWAVRGLDLGVGIVTPGFLNLLGLFACQLLPHALLVPIMAVLLVPRGKGRTGNIGNA